MLEDKKKQTIERLQQEVNNYNLLITHLEQLQQQIQQQRVLIERLQERLQVYQELDEIADK